MKKIVTRLAAVLLSAGLLLSGCGGIDKTATLVNIDGGSETISLGYANFVARTTQAQYDVLYRLYYGDTYWSQTMGEGTMESSVKTDVLDMIEEEYLTRTHASEVGVTMNEEQTDAIEQAVAEFMADNTKEGLEQLGATEDLVREYLTNETWLYLVREQIRSEAEVEIDEDDYRTKAFTYVYLNINGHYDETYTNWISLTEEEQEQLGEDAKTLADADPEKFNDVANELGASILKQTYTPQDLGSDSYALDQAVLEAAEKLDEGEVSDAIEVEGMGWYVVRMDNTNDEEATAEAVEQAEEDARDAHYQEILDGWKEGITWEVNEDLWAQVTFKDLFEELEHEHEEEATEAAEDAAAETTEEAADEEAAAEDTETETTEETAE